MLQRHKGNLIRAQWQWSVIKGTGAICKPSKKECVSVLPCPHCLLLLQDTAFLREGSVPACSLSPDTSRFICWETWTMSTKHPSSYFKHMETVEQRNKMTCTESQSNFMAGLRPESSSPAPKPVFQLFSSLTLNFNHLPINSLGLFQLTSMGVMPGIKWGHPECQCKRR